MIVCIALLSLLALLLAYLLSTWKYDYWKKRNVPHSKPVPLLGNYAAYILMQQYFGEVAQEICRAFPRAPYVGAYYGTEPVLVIQDPEYVKLITAKDFPYFNGREVSRYTDREILTGDLFFTYGDRWKMIRQSMSPLFTSLKLKNMFHLIEKSAQMFEEMLDREVNASDVVEAKILMARYTMDSIGSCGFGVDTNTMAKDANNPFTKMGDMLFDNSYGRGIFIVIRAIWPAIFYGLRLNLFPKEITDFFDDLLIGVFKSRQHKPSARNDFVDLVLNMKKNDYITCDSLMSPGQKVELRIDDELLVGQCVVFFAAGYETSATTLSFALYELAKDEDLQKRAIAEVDDYFRRHEGKLSYDSMSELPFLEACLDETMRLYPVLGVLTREVMQDYTLPDGVKLDKGVRVHLPVFHLHRNADHFPDPEQFRPERFLGEARQRIKPYTYIPFGEGPRICIGMRLAKIQMLPGLLTLLKKYRVQLAEGMARSLPFDPRALVTQARGGIHLRLVRREGWEARVYMERIQ